MREGSDTFSDKFFQGCHFLFKNKFTVKIV